MTIDFTNKLIVINENEEIDIIEKIYKLLRGYDKFKIHIHKKNKLYLNLTVETSKNSICDIIENFYYLHTNFWFLNKHTNDHMAGGLCTGGLLNNEYNNIQKINYVLPDMQFIEYVHNLP